MVDLLYRQFGSRNVIMSLATFLRCGELYLHLAVTDVGSILSLRSIYI